PPTVESARALFRGMFMDPRRYDLARVGRFMINKKLQIDAPLSVKTLRSEDIVAVIRHLLMVKLGAKATADIDHLGNRRVPPCGAGSPRPLPRTRRGRRARRPSNALRPELPERDARRPEHRPDLVALGLRANERVRLHRDAVPEGPAWARHGRDRVPDGARGGAVRHRSG